MRCLVDAIAVCLRNSRKLSTLSLDGILLTPKYISILCSGLPNNENLTSLSLSRCRIGDVGCDLLMGALLEVPNLLNLNLSSCYLTSRCAMSISLFFKKRKVKLLRNDWDVDSLSYNNDSTRPPQGLQSLTLNNNRKLSNSGLRQLIQVLKDDFWLKVLNLRHCGIGKDGGELIIELLQTNSVLTMMDLKENDLYVDVLNIVRMTLKRRQKEGERISMRRRLLNHANNVQNAQRQKIAKKRNRNKNNRITEDIETVKKVKDMKEKERWTSFQRFINSTTPRSPDTHMLKKKNVRKQRKRKVPSNDAQRAKLHELNLRLRNVINCNDNLVESLRNGNDLLKTEKNRRLSVEKTCIEIKSQLETLKNNMVMQNHMNYKTCQESQVFRNLQNVYENLEAFLYKNGIVSNVNTENSALKIQCENNIEKM